MPMYHAALKQYLPLLSSGLRPFDNTGKSFSFAASAVQCSAVQCSAVQCSAVQWSAVQCIAVQCSAVQCSAVQSAWRHCTWRRQRARGLSPTICRQWTAAPAARTRCVTHSLLENLAKQEDRIHRSSPTPLLCQIKLLYKRQLS